MESKEAAESSPNGLQTRPSSEWTPRGIVVVFGSALAYFTTVGFINAFGVLENYYLTDILRNESAFKISWIGSFNFFAIFTFAAPVGIMSDKIGPTVPMTTGSILMLVALMMVSLCKKYWQFFLAQGLLLGMGMSFVCVPASGAVPRFFTRNQAMASGISVAGSSLGGVIWPIVMDQFFFRTSLGFGWSIRIVAFMMLPLMTVAVLTVRMPTRKSEEKQDHVADSPTDNSFLKRPPFILLCVGLVLCSFGFFTPFFYVTSYGVSRGMSQNVAFYTLTAMNAGSGFGRVLPGFVADRFGKFNILAGSAITAAIVGFCWTAAKSTSGIFVWAAVYGFASGGILSLEIAAATSLAPPQKVTTAIGVCFGSTAFAQLFGPPISGEILTHGYTAVSCWCGAVLVAGFLSLVGARLALDRRMFASV